MDFRKVLKKKRFKRSFTVMVTAMFMFVQAMSMTAFAAGEVTGSFAAKAAPTVDSIAVKTVTATAVKTGNTVSNVNSLLLDFDPVNLAFVLNGTLITLTGDAGDYATLADVATEIQNQLTADSNEQVTISSAVDAGPGAHIIITGAANTDIVISSVQGLVTAIGLSTGTTTAVTGPAANLTPNSEYNFEVTVTEPDGLGNATGGLNNVVLKLWYDNGGASSGEGFFNLQTVPSTMQYANITWSKATNTATLSAGAGTSWALTGSTLPTDLILGDIDEVTYTFVFKVKVGEISKETAAVGSKWQIGARATDTDGTTGYNVVGGGFDMNWYGRVVLPDGTLADWGRIDAGLDYADAAAKVAITGLGFLANGVYDHRIKAASTWINGAGGVGNEVTRTAAAAGNDEFALVVDTASTYAVGTAVAVDAVATNTVIVPGGGALAASTTYTPTPRNNYLYLKVNSTFIKGKVFTGTITYVIANA